MIKRQIISVCSFTIVVLAVCGCMSTRTTFLNVLTEPNANVILYVSNQSFDEPLTNILVLIDGRTVVQDEFEVKNQHYWKVYSIHLSPGEHSLYAIAANGTAEINRSFKVSGNHWAALSFWRSKNNTDNSKLKGLTFDIYDSPIGFL